MQEETRLIKLETCMNNIEKRFDKLEAKFDGFLDKLESKYVSKLEFKPIQKLVYGMVGTILTAVLLSVIYVVIK